MKELLILALFFLGTTLASVAQDYKRCPTSIVTNGAFYDQVGENVVAQGWTGYGSPDLNDTGQLNSVAGYSWAGTPLPSHDSGTWQSLYSKYEEIMQTVSVIKGGSYELCFEYAKQRIKYNGYSVNADANLQLYFNDTLVFTTNVDTSTFTWEFACYNFIADTNAIEIRFKPSPYTLYVGIDGVCLILNHLMDTDPMAQQKPVAIYPNPMQDQVQVSFAPSFGPATFTLHDYTGRAVLQKDLSSPKRISTTGLASGGYIYTLTQNHTLVAKGVLVKQ